MSRRLTACLVISMMMLLLLPLSSVQAQNYYQYNISLGSDGSAVWTATYFSSATASVETWESFQEKVYNLVQSASAVTHRNTSVDDKSFQINSTISAQSKVTEYSFKWLNFSMVEGNEIKLGDVFQVQNFFGQLFGDASLALTYPPEFTVKSATPPNQQQDATAIWWPRTEDLVNNPVNVVLVSNGQNNVNLGSWQQYVLWIGLAIAGVLTILGFFAIRRRKGSGKQVNSAPITAVLESEEDKVLKVLRLSGGSLRQSQITEQCNFSKAKTSQLLSEMENKGILARYKKGRDKIVTLNQRVKGEKH